VLLPRSIAIDRDYPRADYLHKYGKLYYNKWCMEDASAYLVKLAEDATLGSTETSRGRAPMDVYN